MTEPLHARPSFLRRVIFTGASLLLAGCGSAGGGIPAAASPAQVPSGGVTAVPSPSGAPSEPSLGPTPASTAAPSGTPTQAPPPVPTATPTPTPAPTPLPTATPGVVLWQAGSATLGRWSDATTYQCGSPQQSGGQLQFTLVQSGTSCGRNQAQPENADGSLSTLTDGRQYAWTFHYIDGLVTAPGPGMGVDAEAQSLIWQIHGTGATGTPCAQLGFGNAANGAQVWQLTDCANGLSNPYWTGTYTPGESDDWEIIALVSASSNGYIQLYRNGTLVANAVGANYQGTAPWWNFGPYKWRWELAGAGGSNMTMVDCTIEGMTLRAVP
jgi:hypothetical protein